MLEARTVTQTVDVAPDTVYEFAGTIENLPLWASGLAARVPSQATLLRQTRKTR